MNTKDTRVALAKAFREVTLSLIGLLDVYEADPDLAEAAAEALGRIFRAHLKNSLPLEMPPNPREALHGLAEEMETAADEVA